MRFLTNIIVDGIIGVGTTTPSATLEVTGSIKFNSLSAASQSRVVTSDNTGNIGYRNLTDFITSITNNISSSTNTITSVVNGVSSNTPIVNSISAAMNAGNLTITVNGQTSTPIALPLSTDTLLSVTGRGNETIYSLITPNITTKATLNTAAIEMRTDANALRWTWSHVSTASGTIGEDLQLNSFSNAGTPTRVLYIKRDNQYVGIATSNPTEQLELGSGKIKTPGIQVTTGASNLYLAQSDASGNLTWVNPSSVVPATPTLQAVTTAGSSTTVKTGFSGGLIVDGGASDTSGFSSNLMLASGFSTGATSGRLRIGDGSGWSFKLSTGTMAAPVDRHTFFDTGNYTATASINAVTGFKYNGAATAGTYLRGDGTNYVSSTIQLADLPSLTNNFWSLNGNALGSKKFLGSTDATNIGFITNGSERLTLLSNGNIGIGVVSPVTPLHVVGAITQNATGGNLYKMWQVNGANNYLQGSDEAIFIGGTATDFGNYLYGNNKWYIATNGIKRLTVDGIGNIGIGTFSPVTKLDIATGEIRINNVYIGKGYGTNTGNNLRIGSEQPSNSTGQNNTTIGMLAMRNNTTGYSNTAIGTDALGSNTTGVFNAAVGVSALGSLIDGNHNMGIGTNSMVYLVSGNYNIGIGTNSLLNNTGASNIGIGYSAGSNITTGNNNIIMGTSSTSSSATASNQLNINNWIKGDNGVIQIPTIPSGASTDSIVTADATGVLRKMSIASIVGSSGWALNGNAIGVKKTLGSTDAFDIGFITSNTEKMTILANGNVGIGNANPAEKLEVNGNIRSIGNSAYTGSHPSIANLQVGSPQFGLAQFNNGNTVELAFLTYGNTAFSVDGYNGNNSFSVPIQGGYNQRLYFATTNNSLSTNSTYWWSARNNAARIVGWNVPNGLDIGTSGAPLRLFANGSNIIGINIQNDKVGIATESATANLDVNGNVRIRTLASGASTDTIVTADATGVINKRTVSDVVGWLKNGNSIYNSNIDYVGIGTPQPAYQLTVRSNGTGAMTSAAEFRDVNGNALLLQNGAGIARFFSTWETVGINSDLSFMTTQASGTQQEGIRVLGANGNVGIGTTNPLSNLHLVYSNNNYDRGFKIQNINTGVSAITGIQYLNSSSVGVANMEYLPTNYANASLQNTFTISTLDSPHILFNTNIAGASGAASGNIIFKIAGNTTPSLFIKGSDGSGNVGIGTTAPLTKLDIIGGDWTSNGGQLRIYNDNYVGAAMTLHNYSSGGRQWSFLSTGIGALGGAGVLSIYDNTTGGTAGYRFTINASGNVGFSTVNPINKVSMQYPKYSTGTASRSTTTVTGVGTTWTASMVGMLFIFADGTTSEITGFTSTTVLTVADSGTVASQAYRIEYMGVQVNNKGNMAIGVTTSNFANLYLKKTVDNTTPLIVEGLPQFTTGLTDLPLMALATTAGSTGYVTLKDITKTTPHYASIITVPTNYTIIATDRSVSVNNGLSDVIITMPNAATNTGRLITIKRKDSSSLGVVSINTANSEDIEKIDGSYDTNFLLPAVGLYGSRVTYISNGVDWEIVSC